MFNMFKQYINIYKRKRNGSPLTQYKKILQEFDHGLQLLKTLWLTWNTTIKNKKTPLCRF